MQESKIDFGNNVILNVNDAINYIIKTKSSIEFFNPEEVKDIIYNDKRFRNCIIYNIEKMKPNSRVIQYYYFVMAYFRQIGNISALLNGYFI